MKCALDLAPFAAAVGRAKAVCGKGVIPIWACVLIAAGDGKVTITASDSERWYVERVKADVSELGALSVDASRLYDILRSGSGDVTLSGDVMLSVTVGRSKYKIAALPADDFPVAPEVDGVTYDLASSDFIRGLARVEPAVSSDTTRPMLLGAHINPNGKTVRFEATSGHQVHASTMPAPKEASKSPRVIVPTNSLAPLRKLAEQDDTTTLTVSKNLLRAVCGSATMLTKVIDRDFPDIDRFVRDDAPNSCIVDAHALRNAVRRVMPIIDDKHNTIFLKTEGGSLHIDVRADHGETGHSKVDAEGDVDIALNGKQLLSLLDAMGGETASILTIDKLAPVRINNLADPTWLGLLVPVKA